ncbi:hypothetical protein B296_00048144 [Ensete ventricosum]|uniref:Uncharacterized protein n=1 Tax=Ensete ventricosum TaxID=4639 RepID=A0A426XJL3_ENSVE|nr:hypothetical protein B296_00048144 [Ensete ventricosum]
MERRVACGALKQALRRRPQGTRSHTCRLQIPASPTTDRVVCSTRQRALNWIHPTQRNRKLDVAFLRCAELRLFDPKRKEKKHRRERKEAVGGSRTCLRVCEAAFWMDYK